MKSARMGFFVITWSLLAFYLFVCPTDSCFAKYSGGAGTPDDPYKIASATDLTTLAGNTSDYGKNFVLTADINLAPNRFTTALIAGDWDNTDTYFDGTPFTGDFNGAGHQISNLVINTCGVQNDFLGLFGLISGRVKNLNLVNVSIIGGDASYYAGELAGENDGNVINCSSSGTITAGYELQYAGGLVGENDGHIINCSSTVALTSRAKSAFVGGLVGYNYDNITGSSATGSVKCGDDSYYIAGLVGCSYGDINDCSSSGKVTAGDGADSVGGLIGNNGGTIRRCFSSGAVTGGINSWRFGGLIGGNYQNNISNCASTGNVSDGNSSQYIGGLVGDNDGNITDCYSTGAVTGDINSGSLGGLIGNNQGSIARCSSKSAVTGGNGALQIGGLVGYNDSGDITDCCSTGNITAGNGADSIGGFVGENDGSVERCLATGTVTGGNKAYYLGGLVGENYRGRVRDSYATGAVTAADETESVGGLVGDNDSGNIGYCSSMANVTAGNESDSIGGLVGSNNRNIFRCFSTGDVSTKTNSYYFGGLVGYSDTNNHGSISDCFSTGALPAGNSSYDFGGLVGIAFKTNIKNCYSTGVVHVGYGSYEAGGLAGWCDGNTIITSSYFLASSGSDNSYGQPLTDAKMKQQSSFVGWDFTGETANGSEDIWDICQDLDYPKLVWTFSHKIGIDKCTVTAGAKKKLGSIAFSGVINTTACDFANADDINVKIDSKYMTRVLTFPVSGYYKKGKYSFSGTTLEGVKESFKFDSKTRKFSFSAKNIDLSGLSCPLNIRINISDYNTEAALDETIVNGPKMPAPANLLMGVDNFLRVDKTQVKHDKTGGQLTITGAFAFEDVNVNLANLNLFVTIGPCIFTIPANNFKPGTGTYSCSDVELLDGGTIGARFDLNKCSFVITVKHYSVSSYSGTVNFGIDFAGFSETANAIITP